MHGECLKTLRLIITLSGERLVGRDFVSASRCRKFAFAIVLAMVLIPVNAAETEPFDYVLRDLDGVEYRASDSIGKWLVINFWATWCAPCVAEMPELQKFHETRQEQADLWGVTFEDTDIDAIRAFVARLGVTYPILGYGQDPKTGYGPVRVLPTTFVIDPEGRFHHKFEGPISADDLVDIMQQNSGQDRQ